MSREPCMTLSELGRLYNLDSAALTRYSKKIPYPDPVVFEQKSGFTPNKRRSRQYRRSALLNWLKEVTTL